MKLWLNGLRHIETRRFFAISVTLVSLTACTAMENAFNPASQISQVSAASQGGSKANAKARDLSNQFNSTMVPQHSQQSCVDVPANLNQSQIPLQQWSCNSGPQQSFNFVSNGNGGYSIQTSNGLCLDSLGSQGQVDQWDCNGGPNQTWSLQQQWDGNYLIQNQGDSLCLNIDGGNSNDGSALITYGCDGGAANERFAINGGGQSNPAPQPPAAPASAPSGGGMMVGVAPMGVDQYVHEQGVQSFENFLGRHVDFAVDFIEDSNWGGFISDFDYAMDGWQRSNPNRLVMWSLPLTTGPHGCGGCGTPLSEVAAGYHDNEFYHVAQGIAQHQPNAIIRIGWEFNTTDYPWSATGGHQQDYINAFRHVAQIFKQTSSQFTIVWCPLVLQRSGDVQSSNSYPGDDVVDVIGVDYYDDNWGSSQQRWDYTVNSADGLQWQVDFAHNHGKQLSFPEWGAGKAGDNPDFIHNMANWMRNNGYSSQSYWEGGDGTGYNSYIEDYRFGGEAQAFLQEFRGY